ncbi:hypothetical protein ACIA8G_05325 [Lentzea sp. NPDC051213]|uniref:hypothetical protein n=1 Tax=Lentzea sp. NPDC051213 TaxID=3364126 RepID=UPI0037874792
MDLETLRRALKAHVGRPVLRDGVRRISVEVLVADTVQMRLEIGQVWHSASGHCDSVLCVLPGSPFAGTAVLMREQALVKRPQMWVWPATAEGPVAVARHRCEDQVVGTDFGYDDIRMFTPRLLTAAIGAEPADGGFTVRGMWPYKDRDPVVGVGRVDEHGVLVAVDLIKVGAIDPFRQLRADRVAVVDGMPTPTVIRVVRPEEGFSSVMRLVAMTHGDPVARKLFTAERLREAATAVTDASSAVTMLRE